MTISESEKRISELQNRLNEKRLDGALIVLPIDVYYFSGTRQNSILWVPAEGLPVLFVRKSISRAADESLIKNTRPFPPGKEFIAFLNDSKKKIGMTFDILPVQQYDYYRGLFPDFEFQDISYAIRAIRSVKSPWEIERLVESGRIQCSVFKQAPDFIKEGMRELDLAAELEYRLRKTGAEGYTRMRAFNQELFQGLAVSGNSAGAPGFFDGPVTGVGLSSASPHGASQKIIRRNEPVMLDYTGTYNGYMVDMARMFVIGDLLPELKNAFKAALAIQDYIALNMRPGVVCQEIFSGALDMADKASLRSNFMGVPGENAKFVGHGVGLELDEYPILAQGFKMPLEEGHVIAVEPKFVFPNIGAVGVENTFAVSAGGGVKLTDLDDEIVYLR